MSSLARFGLLAQSLGKNTHGSKSVLSAVGSAARRALAVQTGGTTKISDAIKPVDSAEYEDEDEDLDLLEGKASGDVLRKAFAERSAAAVRYEYFAQRAELEAELEAASALRSLTEVAKQQALGFLELLEEFGTHTDEAGSVKVGTTLDNVAATAVAERADVERYAKHADQADTDGVDELMEWYSDMSDASTRTADRLELVSSLMDAEYEALEEDEEDEDDGAEEADGPDGAKGSTRKKN
jgi:rubrerythrin